MTTNRRTGFEKSQVRHLFAVWGVFLLVLVSGTITARAYIGNSQEAKERYETLVAVDEAGGDVEKALFDLRSFIYAHMNTTIGSETGIKPPIQLQGTYRRLVALEKARVKQANDDLYSKAQQDCERRFPNGLSGGSRVPCITEYVSQNAVKEESIPKGLYQYDFVPPFWSPDTAGIGMIITFALAILFLSRLFVYKRMLHHSRLSS